MRKIPPFTTRGPLVVALVYDGLCTFEFSIAAEIFGLPRPEMGRGWYRFASCAVDRGPLRAQGGLSIRASGNLALVDRADIVIVPGWKGVAVPVPRALVTRLTKVWQRGARLASICSGAFVLAATGLLDGKRATTHWRHAGALQAAYPNLTVDAGVLYIQEDRLLTSAGSAAGIDLMLHIVRSDFGSEAANSVARRLVTPPHRNGGQAQFIERPVPEARRHELSGLLDRVRAQLGESWPLKRLARELAMSERTFLRRFAQATGRTPADWLIDTRLDEARRALERTRLSVEQIAAHCGFGSVATLRHHFSRRIGLAPRAYRERFTAAGDGSRRAIAISALHRSRRSSSSSASLTSRRATEV
jgi:AraC family transcriptional activator FtrA